MLGLLGSDYPKYGMKNANGLGVVVDTNILKGIEFEIDKEDSANWEWYSQIFEMPPSSGFSELPIEVTNTVSYIRRY